MFKKTIEDIKLARLSYLIEQIKTKDLKVKFKVFKKLDKMKLSTNMGLMLLDASIYNYNIEDGNGGINSSLFSLCLKDYKIEYSDKILKIFNKYSDECKDKIMFLLSSNENEEALKLYTELILKYYKNKEFIPIGNLYERVNAYYILFPKLFKALKFNNYKNNILVLLNHYLNSGVMPDSDIVKYKRTMQLAVNKIINDSFKFKFSSTSKALQNEEYIGCRFFLEIAVNLEYYVSSNKSKQLLDKLFKRNDNQIKLFIIENYIKKLKDLKKLNFLPIAKDNASRYPLYDLLSVYELLEYFPKQYLKPTKLAESDLFINFSIYNGYKETPKFFKFIKEIEIDKHLYYVFTFKYNYQKNENYDYTTDYLIKNAGLEKYKNQKITYTYVGMSGGYSLTKKPSLIQTTNDKILWDIKKENETIDEVIERIKNTFSPKETKEEIEKEIVVEEEIEQEEVIKKRRFKFGYVLIFLLFILLVSIGAFITFLQRPDLIKVDSNNKITIKEPMPETSKMKYMDSFKEISGKDLFKQPEQSYYVLLFKKKSDKNSYYTYLNKLIENNYKIYYVDLTKDENKFLYQANDLNFTVFTDRFVKIEEGDFSFYVDGKANILDEFEKDIKEIEKIKKEEKKEKENNTKKKEE